MSAEALYEAMGLKGYEVEGTWTGDEGVLHVQVAVPREKLACRACGCSRVQRQGGQRREWKAAPIGVTPVIITMDSPRVKCLECGAKTWHQPAFAEGQRHVTKTFERTVEAWLWRVTIQDAVEMFGTSWHTVSDIDLDLERLKKLPKPKLSEVQRLAIDENYLGRRHGFVTVVLDLDSKAIVSVVKGRGKIPLREVFALLKAARAKITSVATDMAGGYIAAVMEHLPKAALVFDRFHVVKLMNEKLTDLRREMYHELTDKQHRKMLKGTRYLLMMNPENLKQNAKVDEKAQLQEALKLNESLSIPYCTPRTILEVTHLQNVAAAADIGLGGHPPPSANWLMPYTFGTITQSYASINNSINHWYTAFGATSHSSRKFRRTMTVLRAE